MKIGVTSQNFKTITGHAGKARRFLVFSQDGEGKTVELDRLDLPKALSMHEFRGGVHPTDDFDVLITGGCGDGFRMRMASRGIRVVTTSETNPERAVTAVLSGLPLPEAEPHSHES
jgi:predicted Fe-Mo cluster-binding NifX family protein